MQKRIKRAIIITIVSLVLLTLLLVLLGLGKVNLNEYALNYSTITADYADNNLYGPGLYWIGISNKFIRFNKNQQTLRFTNLSAFSSDFYKITANMKIAIQFNFSAIDSANLTNFTVASNFLQLFDQSPLNIIQPLIKNQILIALSSKNSLFYQSSSGPNALLQADLSTSISGMLQAWIRTSVNVIVESVICEGTTSNTEIIDRQIQSLMNDLQRASSEQVELTSYFNTTYDIKHEQINSAFIALNQKALQLNRIYQLYGATTVGYNISKIIYDNKPLKYNLNLVDMLQNLAIMGNRTFPY